MERGRAIQKSKLTSSLGTLECQLIGREGRLTAFLYLVLLATSWWHRGCIAGVKARRARSASLSLCFRIRKRDSGLDQSRFSTLLPILSLVAFINVADRDTHHLEPDSLKGKRYCVLLGFCLGKYILGRSIMLPCDIGA